MKLYLVSSNVLTVGYCVFTETVVLGLCAVALESVYLGGERGRCVRTCLGTANGL